ncbi:STN domain-containing protein [Puia sp. P3]|uniref:STN domain-containing protein n=1 Tax=Puia sp. P3 TaxID=3423952 RepID=UPI003D66CD16
MAGIEKQSIYHFVYSERKIPSLKGVDINVRNEEVPTLLDNLLAGSGFKYNLLANHLIVITKAEEEAPVMAPPSAGKLPTRKASPS